jgi:hypothetical protein
MLGRTDGSPVMENRRRLGFADAKLELQSPTSGVGTRGRALEDSGWRRAPR